MDDISKEEAAELLLLLREYPPAEIMGHVPRAGNIESSQDRSLLLTSIGAITAILGAGIVFMEKLFEGSNYNFNTILRYPSWGEYMVELTPEQQRQWCTNTAYYIDAMRTNKQLIIIGTGNEKRIRPVPSDSTGLVTFTPESSMILNGNEVITKDRNNNMVYSIDKEVFTLPTDPVELSAFCMAHFIHKEKVQTLINWGEDFQLISEEDLLRILGEGNEDWKTNIVNNILKNAYDVYKQTQEFNTFIKDGITSTSGQIDNIQGKIHELIDKYPQFKDKCLLKIAKEHPELWVAGNYAVNYPIQSSLLFLFLAFYMRKEVKKVGEMCGMIGNTSIRFLKWLTGQNPDDSSSTALVTRGGGKRKRDDNELTVILISNPLPEKYIDKLNELFDTDNINKLVNYITKIKKKGYTARLRRRIVKAFKKITHKLHPDDPTSVTAIRGGKRKTSRFTLLKNKITKKKNQNRRKTQKR